MGDGPEKLEDKGMSREKWTRYLVAAALVLLAGSVWVLAEDTKMKVEVRNHGGQEITIDVNGVTEDIALDDLAEGEERTFDVGGHQISVRRVDDQLMLVHEGDVMGDLKHVGEDDDNFVWVTKGGDCNAMFVSEEGEGEPHYVIVEKGDGDTETIELQGEPHAMKWHVASGEGGPCLHNDVVTYRCEETGSLLVVKKDENLLDSYIDPVTGCVMEKVETPQRKIKVFVKEIEIEDDGSDD